MKRKYFKLFDNCKIVKGINRDIICDLQRNRYHLVPKSLTQLFDDNALNLENIKQKIDKDSLEILNEYISLLNDNEFIFECSKKELSLFPVLNIEFDYPAKISNMVIDLSLNSKHCFDKILNNFLIPP